MPVFIQLLNGIFFQIMVLLLTNTVDAFLIRFKLDNRAEPDTGKHILNLLGTIQEYNLNPVTYGLAGGYKLRDTLTGEEHQFCGIKYDLLQPLPLVTGYLRRQR